MRLIAIFLFHDYFRCQLIERLFCAGNIKLTLNITSLLAGFGKYLQKEGYRIKRGLQNGLQAGGLFHKCRLFVFVSGNRRVVLES
jgi:hypothetical protein